jgi:CDP-paratose 2-epimerase
MRILISGICGFVGSWLAKTLLEERPGLEIFGFDSFVREGSEINRAALRELGIKVMHADLRATSDIDALPPADVVIDAAANPSVLAGVDGKSSSRQLLEHNLGGTINLLEYCRQHKATFLLLSTSRVYSVPGMSALPVRPVGNRFEPNLDDAAAGVSGRGFAESFSTAPPLSLYGSSKLASELLALEYGSVFNFPVWINRCGVLAGAGQFGRADQGIYSFWLHAWKARRTLRYLGFGGEGLQVRDALHPRDLVPLLLKQIDAADRKLDTRIFNVSGGLANSMSLAQLSVWAEQRWGANEVIRDGTPRPFDLPWIVLDATLAESTWDWQVRSPLPVILEEIAEHVESHPHWLSLTGA